MNYSDQFFLFYFENFTMCSKEQHHWRWRLNLYDGIIYFLMTSGIIVIVIVIEYFKMMWSIIIIINPLAIFILTYCHFLRHFYPRKFAKHHFALSHQCLNVLLFGITRLRLSLERIENRLYMFMPLFIGRNHKNLNCTVITKLGWYCMSLSSMLSSPLHFRSSPRNG